MKLKKILSFIFLDLIRRNVLSSVRIGCKNLCSKILGELRKGTVDLEHFRLKTWVQGVPFPLVGFILYYIVYIIRVVKSSQKSIALFAKLRTPFEMQIVLFAKLRCPSENQIVLFAKLRKSQFSQLSQFLKTTNCETCDNCESQFCDFCENYEFFSRKQ